MPLTARAEAPTRAFDELIGPWIEPGFRLAVTMLGDPEEARDAVQDAALAAWRSLHRLQEPAHARAWFFSIVANRCRSIARRHWWTRGRNPLIAETTAGPAESADRSIDIERGMSRLEPDDRAALLLRFYLDLTVEEVGRALGVSAGAARSRIYRAAGRLRQSLDEDELR